ncbi:isochorismatase family protein [Pusillimonas minor]|uniref:Isochorismatase family protein n=1 Tax=Pusillimonas minor TaxID=2697024 RepID=A0A842HMR2_9BURK|nr:isochorismatase family protein [Pusillimonas minor]MBC2769012.1 isochorismatase family protein [Pusillimonas minor]
MGGLTDDEAFFAARGFGVKIGFGKRPAVLVIDLTKGFTDAQRPLGADLSSQITVANEIITSAKNKEVPVIFTAVRYDNPNLIDAGIWAMKQKGVASLLASGDGHELDERLSANWLCIEAAWQLRGTLSLVGRSGNGSHPTSYRLKF